MKQTAAYELERLVTGAVFGDKRALEGLIETTYRPVYNLSLRMLRYPQAAEDATQEILIKVITQLGSFQRKSAFMSWVFRVASNHLLSARKKTWREAQGSFDEIAERLEFSLALSQPSPEARYEDELLIEEVRRSCTLGMLAALSQKQRMALILGEIYEFTDREAAHIMATSPQAYRKQLSRARADLTGFVAGQCGVVNSERPCRCYKHVGNKVRTGQLEPKKLSYATEADAQSRQQAVDAERVDLTRHRRAAALLRSHPNYRGSEARLDELKSMFEKPGFESPSFETSGLGASGADSD